MKKLTKSLIMAILVAIGLAAFSGCRTAHGFGEDMEKAGQSVQDKTN